MGPPEAVDREFLYIVFLLGPPKRNAKTTPARVPASAEEQDETNGEISETSRCASRLLLACASQATAVS